MAVNSKHPKYAEFEGHEIYSKPYGFFNNEALNAPNPVGISTVGNPKYGEWKTDKDMQQRKVYVYGRDAPDVATVYDRRKKQR